MGWSMARCLGGEGGGGGEGKVGAEVRERSRVKYLEGKEGA